MDIVLDNLFVSGLVTVTLGLALYWFFPRPDHEDPRQYSYVIPGSEDYPNGLGPIHRHPTCKDKLNNGTKYMESTTIFELFQRGVRVSGDANCLGYRPIKDGVAQPFEWESYSDVNERVKHFGYGLLNLDLVPIVQGTRESGPMRLLAIFAKNCKEWLIAEQGMYSQGGTIVPLYDTYGVDAVVDVFSLTEVSTVLCNVAGLPKVVQAAKRLNSPVKNVILIGNTTELEKSLALSAKLNLYSFTDVEKSGKNNPLTICPPKGEQIATFQFTSGTTGKSKGALLSHSNMIAEMSIAEFSVPLDHNTVHLSFLPMAHVYERCNNAAILASGGSIGVYQGKTEAILDDLKALQPTIFPAVPRILNKIHDNILQEVKKVGGWKEVMFNFAYSSKQSRLKAGSQVHLFWDFVVFKPVAAKIGLNKVRLVLSGSAPISDSVLEFLRIVFSCAVAEGYGSTETSGGSTATSMTNIVAGHVGGPMPCNEIRLASVKEMGYLVTDTDHQGTPVNGRGEIQIRGHNIFKGYYKNYEQTADVLSGDGWLKTGDIGIWNTNGTLTIVDRKKNIFKLSQGEYVAPEKVENIYQKCSYVAQVFVHGDSLQSCLVGVVVPEMDVVRKWAGKNGLGSVSDDDLLHNAELKKEILKAMGEEAKASHLFGFEQVRDISLYGKLFTPDDLLTSTMKLKRHEAKLFFQKEIAEMYSRVGDIKPARA